jgi:hypothetical protein
MPWEGCFLTGECPNVRLSCATTVCVLLLIGGIAHAQDEAPWAERPTPEPGDVTVHADRVTFRWSPMEDAQGYRLQVGKTLLFMPTALDERTTRPVVDIKTEQLPPRLYYWRVSVVGKDGVESGFSSVRILNLTPQRNAAPRQQVEVGRKGVIIYKPTDPWPGQVLHCRSSVGHAAVMFRWSGKAWRSRVQVASDEKFEHLEKDQTILKRSNRVDVPVGPHHYRLAQFSAKRGWVPVWSEVRHFSVETDDAPPMLRVATPASQVFTVNRTVTLQGATEPGVTLALNGRTLDVSERGEFIIEAALKEGRNNLTLMATDEAGNQSTHLVVAVRIPETLQQTALARLVTLQKRLNDLDAAREDLDLQAEDLSRTLIGSDRSTPDLADGLLTLQKDLRTHRSFKRELDEEVVRTAQDVEDYVDSLNRKVRR